MYIETQKNNNLRQVLKEEYGFTFVESRLINLPIISAPYLSRVVKPACLDSAMGAISTLEGYINGPIVMDSWGGNHEKRREQRKELEKIFGGDFIRLIHHDNKLSANTIASVNFSIHNLSNYIEQKETELRRRIAHIQKELQLRFSGVSNDTREFIGKKYSDMSAHERLETVYFYEDKIREILCLFSSE